MLMMGDIMRSKTKKMWLAIIGALVAVAGVLTIIVFGASLHAALKKLQLVPKGLDRHTFIGGYAVSIALLYYWIRRRK